MAKRPGREGDRRHTESVAFAAGSAVQALPLGRPVTMTNHVIGATPSSRVSLSARL
jgi:hypothetical protein